MSDKPFSQNASSRPPRRRESANDAMERKKHDDAMERDVKSPVQGQRPGKKEDARHSGKPRDKHPGGAAAALIELDRDLMKLLVRRATLVSRIREGREHAASPAAIQAEKAVRLAWESGALSFSKDPHFVRQLFTLLQDIKVMSKEQAHASATFNLAPAKRPVNGVITGPRATRAAQMRMALAAAHGSSLTLEHVLCSSALRDSVKLGIQAGAVIDCRPQGAGLCVLEMSKGKPLDLSDRTLFAGEDLFMLYLAVFMILLRPGTYRFTGGARLKAADLTPLRQCLPLFGARLAHVIPRSQGLPANIEVSGEIPPVITVPADLPFEGLCALLLAPLGWNIPVTLNLAALPASTATAALAEVRPLQRDAGADLETHGPTLVYTPTPLTLSPTPALPLDPVLSGYLLALPAFAKGSITLTGLWPEHTPAAQEVQQLLAWAGLELEHTEQGVTSRAAEQPYNPPLQFNDLVPELGPLFIALAAGKHARGTPLPPLQTLAPFPQDDLEEMLIRDFYARLGLAYVDGTLRNEEQGELESAPWTAPDAHWGMAFALCAFLRSGLKLANPGTVTEVMPPFWGIYNSLPEPCDPAQAPQRPKPEPTTDEKPVRRRIIAD